MAKLYTMGDELKTLGAVASNAPVQKNTRYQKYDPAVSAKPDMLGKGKYGRYDKTVLSPSEQASVNAYHASKGKIK